MTCFYPLDAWRGSTKNPSGKTPLVFSRRDSEPDTYMQIPCGKCDGCKMDAARDWSTRLQCESMLYDRNSFLTLTYSDSHLPSDGKLNKEHVQNFVRSLRDRGNKFRYFACGEYGGLTHRPHYHMVVFNMDFMSPNQEPCGDNMFMSPELMDIWKKGSVVCAPVTPASCSYVAGYVNKKIGDKDTFSLKSKRPPIGKDWFDRYYKDVIAAEGVVESSGKVVPVPKVFFKWDRDDSLQVLKDKNSEYLRKLDMDTRLDKWRERGAKAVCASQVMKERLRRER